MNVRFNLSLVVEYSFLMSTHKVPWRTCFAGCPAWIEEGATRTVWDKQAATVCIYFSAILKNNYLF